MLKEHPGAQGDEPKLIEIGEEVPLDDRALAEQAFPGWRVLFSESFMWVSRNSYPFEWSTREIVQNWVDENPVDPGTLNGVTSKMEPTHGASEGTQTFSMTGAWPFRSYGPLMDLGSGKLEAKGSAGGNGLGIKQAALLAMRDHDVQEFKVLGEGWEVQYRLVPAAEVNAALEAQSNPRRVQYGAFMARVIPSRNRGECSVMVTTSNPKTQAVLAKAKELAVCDENPHLQGMHFRNAHGGVRWLPLSAPSTKEDTESGPSLVERGRLFINGQVYRYQESEDRAGTADFWGGPLGVTLQFNRIDYQRTLDRPPMNRWDLRRHVMDWLGTLKREELILNLQASEHLWASRPPDKSNEVFALVVVEAIVDRLRYYHRFSAEDYSKIFGEKSYLCLDQEIPTSQRDLLKKRGFTLCPGFFEGIHMPKASAQLSDTDRAATNVPNLYEMQNGLLRLSIEAGVPISFGRLDVEGGAELGGYLRQRLGRLLRRVTPREEVANAVRLVFEERVPKETLVQQKPPEEWDRPGRVFHTLAGAVHAGLRQGLFEAAHFVQGEYVATFLAQGDMLAVRNTPASSDQIYLEVLVNPNHFSAFQSGLGVNPPESAEVQSETPRTLGERVRVALEDRGILKPRGPVASIDRQVRRARAQRLLRTIPIPGPVTATVASLFLAVAGGAGWAYSRQETPDPTLVEILEAHDDVRPSTTWGQEWVQVKKESIEAVRILLAPLMEGVQDAHEEAKRENLQFETVEPNPTQTQQIELLKEYVRLTTRHEIKKPFFIYQGPHHGINTGGQAIGLNVAHLEGGFEQAVEVVLHEIAHDGVLTQFDGDHGPEWQHVLEALNAEVHETLADIARSPEETRTEDSRKLLAIEQQWDQLRR